MSHLQHSVFSTVLTINRDEYYERPTDQAQFWPESPDIIAGRDLKVGGTWFGANRFGRFAVVTNYRDPRLHRSDAESRGEIVKRFLEIDAEPESFFSELRATRANYNGYNLLFKIGERLFYYSSRQNQVQELEPGYYALSNADLDTPWPKIVHGKKRFIEIISGLTDSIPLEEIFAIMTDRTIFPDDVLPSTGVGLDRERMLSAIFVQSEKYGTRSTTIYSQAERGKACFIERTYDRNGNPVLDSKYLETPIFPLTPPGVSPRPCLYLSVQ